MQFTVPQFIEKKTKIVGPFTFEQFILVLTAGGFCLIIYFVLPFGLFLMITITLATAVLALSFVKIEGIPLPTILKNSFLFLTSPKIYLWHKKTFIPKLIERKIEPIKKEEEKVLKVAQHSRLKDLSTQLEIKTKD